MYRLTQYLAQLDYTKLPQGVANQPKLVTIFNIMFGTVGALAFIIIVLAGFKYIISRGDPKGIETAKNTILYAVIGLMVCISATVIVNFVLRGL